MKTYLFSWNPKKWTWETLESDIENIEKTGRSSLQWSVVSHKKIKQGDRAFLMRLGENPKGIIASGFISTNPFLAPHWDGSDRLVNRVMIDFEAILNPKLDPIFSLEEMIKNPVLKKFNWTPQSSGIEIDSLVSEELESSWFKFLNKNEVRRNPFKLDIKNEQKIYTEGSPNQVTVTKYERNPHARKVCLDHYGYNCAVCDFNFEKVYGEVGKNFIHVHHLNQVADIGKEYTINPIEDLRPVCPNCHSMIHKKKEAYTIKEIKNFITPN